jgi:signal transduction histidine kinase
LQFQSDEHKDELIESKNLAIEASSAKTMFISTISHELRTPLNAILGFGQLIKMSDSVKPGSEEYENAGGVVESGKHLLSLIEELLDLSKLESGNLVVNIGEVSLMAIISESMAILNPIADKYKITITNKATDDYLVLADSIRLKQVMINLISNAIKYNHPNGNVTIDVKKAASNRVKVSVKDSGTGLSAAQQATLFQSFQRFDTTREGIGLGLYITKRLINLMHGEIGVESKLNKGSTFWFELPLAEEIQDVMR